MSYAIPDKRLVADNPTFRKCAVRSAGRPVRASVLQQLWRDDGGVILSAELVVIMTVTVLAVAVGLSKLATQVNAELLDVASAVGSLDQSFRVNGIATTHSFAGNCGFVAGSGFFDGADVCDCAVITSTSRGGGFGAGEAVGVAGAGTQIATGTGSTTVQSGVVQETVVAEEEAHDYVPAPCESPSADGKVEITVRCVPTQVLESPAHGTHSVEIPCCEEKKTVRPAPGPARPVPGPARRVPGPGRQNEGGRLLIPPAPAAEPDEDADVNPE